LKNIYIAFSIIRAKIRYNNNLWKTIGRFRL